MTTLKKISEEYPEAILLRVGLDHLPDGSIKITRIYQVLGMILKETEIRPAT